MLSDPPLKTLFPGTRPLLADTGYRGPLRYKPYFEGWYMRHVTADHSRSLAVIVGLSLVPDPHAFIQVVSGPSGDVYKKRYPLSALRARRDTFDVALGDNRFSTEGIELHIDSPELQLDGYMEYGNCVELPGIMGPFKFVPFMECIHGTLSVDHDITGVMDWNGDKVDFSGGRGYIEKDRGRSMPRSWIWVQTNQFENRGDSFMLSVARIPWMGLSFTGHLGYLRCGAELFRFATYTGSRVSGRYNADALELRISDRRRVIDLAIQGMGNGAVLDAPVNGSMTREIVETPRAQLSATFSEHHKGIVWEGRTETVSVELVGEIHSLLTKPSSSRV